MCVCSAMTSDSKPRCSIARASDTVSMLLSVTNVEIPNFIVILNCRALPTIDVHQGQVIPGDTETTGTRAGLGDLTKTEIFTVGAQIACHLRTPPPASR